MKSYEKDYKETLEVIEDALKQRAGLDAEIEAHYRRLDALKVLIEADYPDKGRHVLRNDMSPASAMVNLIEPTVTERVRGVLMASTVPLTTGEIYEKLKGMGEGLDPKANPWALIHGICRRLTQQGFAQQVEKGVRKAWIVAQKGP